MGVIHEGPWAGRYIFAYADTQPEWWTIVISPPPQPGVPGDLYLDGNHELAKILVDWRVDWITPGPEETRIEREEFGWRPLLGPPSWLISETQPSVPPIADH